VPSRFQDLAAYQRAAALGDELHRTVKAWDTFDRNSCGKQLLRAIDSVGANIAESSGRWHGPDKRQLLIVARGSLLEAEHWITRAEARGLLEKGTALRIAEIARPLNGLIRRPGPTPAGRGPRGRRLEVVPQRRL
jgi:four helix bundle protein